MRPTTALVLSLMALFAGSPGCGGRSASSTTGVMDSGGAEKDGAGITDSGAAVLCEEIGGSCQQSCPKSAPEYVYPPVQQSCKGKKCCVAQCQRPSWLCTSSQDCKEGEVCTVVLGACDVDPCCPMCAQCHGRCQASAFSAKVTSASVGADLMPGGPVTISATLELKLDNSNSYAVSDVEVLKGTILLAADSTTVSKLIWANAKPFSGKVAAQSSAAVPLYSKGQLAAGVSAPCNQMVKVWAEVRFFKGSRIAVTSDAEKLGCAY